MHKLLVPLNQQRTRKLLQELSFFTTYSKSGAQKVKALLQTQYPQLFARMEEHPFANGAFTLEMTGASTADPLIFVSHLDSLSCKIPSDTEGKTTVPLQRAHLLALLEALDALLSEGYRPGGDLILALSMDGLSGGTGAKSIAAYLQKRKIQPCFVLDHGGYVTNAAFRRFLPSDAPLALIGITEKGQLEGKIETTEAPYDGMGSALNMLLKNGAWLTKHSRRASLCRASEQMLRTLSPHSPWRYRLLLEHPRFFFPILHMRWRKREIMEQFFLSELTVTAIHTKGEPSRPPSAASLRFSLKTVPSKRLLPWWQTRLHQNTCRQGAKLTVSIENEHSSRSRVDAPAWDALETAIEILFDRVVIAPCLSPYVTDGRFYAPLQGKVYRFSPFLLTAQEALRGECTIDDDALQIAVQFFRQMLSV